MDIYFRFLLAFASVGVGFCLYFLFSKCRELHKRVSDLEAQVDAYLKEHLDDYIDEKYKK